MAAGSHTGAWIEDILWENNVAFLQDNGMYLLSTPPTGGGIRRVVFRQTAFRECGTRNTGIQAGGRTYTNAGMLGSPLILTLAFTAGSNVFQSAKQSARFADIHVECISVDNGNTSSGSAWLSVDGYDGLNSALGYAETFHTNVTFKTLRITNARAAVISRLRDSAFRDVNITSWAYNNNNKQTSSSSTPWNVSNCMDVQFVDVRPMPNGFQ